MHDNIIIGGRVLLDVDFILEKAEITEGVKIADFGCGSTGHYIFSAAERVGKNGRVYAVDILKTVLETIGRRSRVENFSNITTVWSDIEQFKATKIENSSLDAGLLINTLYQSKKRSEMLREIIRLLKNNGKLVVVEWKSISTPIGPPAENKVNKDNLIEMAKKMGLKFEEQFFAGKFHYGLIFTKI